MTRVLSGLAAAATIAGGWVLVATLYSKADATIVLQPVVHPAYDPAQIDRDIAQHQAQVKGDPQGAIGWSMLSAAYLARSRESDSDKFAWKAEDAAAKSLALRTHRNGSAWLKLVQSLLEQHRFQDALAKTDQGLARFPGDLPLMRVRADVLIEIGRLDDAAALLAAIPDAANGAETAPLYARIASHRGEHEKAIALLRQTIAALMPNPSIPQPSIAWYVTKIGNEQEAMGDLTAAQKSYDEGVKLFPRSYKAWLGKARLATERKDYTAALVACEEVLKIANSLEARALQADVCLAQGDKIKANAGYAEIKSMVEDEVGTFDSLGKGGPLRVKPIDRQFATFAATHRMFMKEALPAARRDYANRPDEIAKANLRELSR
jgi:tetratricopeptide (TPR) repeat protein